MSAAYQQLQKQNNISAANYMCKNVSPPSEELTFSGDSDAEEPKTNNVEDEIFSKWYGQRQGCFGVHVKSNNERKRTASFVKFGSNKSPKLRLVERDVKCRVK